MQKFDKKLKKSSGFLHNEKSDIAAKIEQWWE